MTRMRTWHLQALILGVTLTKGAMLVALVGMEFDPGRGGLVDYGILRSILVGMSTLVMALLVSGSAIIFARQAVATRICSAVDGLLDKPGSRLFLIQGTLLVLALLSAEGFLLSYLAIPVPFRPVLAWASLSLLLTWGVLRLAYAAAYRARPSWTARLREGWRAWLPVQRRTFLVLVGMGLVYFALFIPGNYLRDEDTHFHLHPDEEVIYPDIARVLVWRGTFSDMVHLTIEEWPWWYGYPYLPLSAMVLIGPRSVFGSEYASQIQVNIFLLRQFISVLPMVLSLLLAVYLVNRFRSLWQSSVLFLFLALLPGVVFFNHRFWHPDSIILLLILLTFHLLETDDLRFGKRFYLAAVLCGLATAIKLWGVFFAPAIAGYLIAGLWKKRLTLKRAVGSGLGFILTMTITIIITSPGLLAPYIRNGALEGWAQQQNSLLQGYNEPDPEGVYERSLPSLLRVIQNYYMLPYFFVFSFLSLMAGSLWGRRKTFYRVVLAWTVSTAFFMATFAAMKSSHYLLILTFPLCLGALLFSSIAEEILEEHPTARIRHAILRGIAWGGTGAAILVQFFVNLGILANSHVIGF